MGLAASGAVNAPAPHDRRAINVQLARVTSGQPRLLQVPRVAWSAVLPAVICPIPKLIVRVRFPSPAPDLESAVQMPYSPCSASARETSDCGPRARCVPDRRPVRFAPDAFSSRRAILSRAAPLRGTASGAPRAGLWPWGGPARRARAVPVPAVSHLTGPAGQTCWCGMWPSSSRSIVPVAANASRAPAASLRDRRSADPGPADRSQGLGSYQENGSRAGSQLVWHEDVGTGSAWPILADVVFWHTQSRPAAG